MTKASEKFPWDSKLDKAFFRGSRTSNERDSLILLSRSEPDLVDAAFTKNQAWRSGPVAASRKKGRPTFATSIERMRALGSEPGSGCQSDPGSTGKASSEATNTKA